MLYLCVYEGDYFLYFFTRFINLLNEKRIMNFLFTKIYVSSVCNIRRFVPDESGVISVEYAIVFAGVAAVTAVIFGRGGVFESMMTNFFNNIQSLVLGSMSVLP